MWETRFARNVGSVRRARDMTQEELATAVGLGRYAIVAVEAGGRRIRLSEAYAIAAALGVTLDAMVSNDPVTITIAVPR